MQVRIIENYSPHTQSLIETIENPKYKFMGISSSIWFSIGESKGINDDIIFYIKVEDFNGKKTAKPIDREWLIEQVSKHGNKNK